MASDSHFEAPADSNCKYDRLERLLTTTDDSRLASLHPLVATGASTADNLPSSHDSHLESGIQAYYIYPELYPNINKIKQPK